MAPPAIAGRLALLALATAIGGCLLSPEPVSPPPGAAPIVAEADFYYEERYHGRTATETSSTAGGALYSPGGIETTHQVFTSGPVTAIEGTVRWTDNVPISSRAEVSLLVRTSPNETWTRPEAPAPSIGDAPHSFRLELNEPTSQVLIEVVARSADGRLVSRGFDVELRTHQRGGPNVEELVASGAYDVKVVEYDGRMYDSTCVQTSEVGKCHSVTYNPLTAPVNPSFEIPAPVSYVVAEMNWTPAVPGRVLGILRMVSENPDQTGDTVEHGMFYSQLSVRGFWDAPPANERVRLVTQSFYQQEEAGGAFVSMEHPQPFHMKIMLFTPRTSDSPS